MYEGGGWMYKENECDCVRGVRLVLLLTDVERVLSQGRVNGGITEGCNGEEGEMLVYRKEEWLKVVLHECMHRLGLEDYGGTERERYVEYWSERIHLALWILRHTQDPNEWFDKYLEEWNKQKLHTQQRIHLINHTPHMDPHSPIDEYFHRKAIMMGTSPLTPQEAKHTLLHIQDLRMTHPDHEMSW